MGGEVGNGVVGIVYKQRKRTATIRRTGERRTEGVDKKKTRI